jgi:hypothetical protein
MQNGAPLIVGRTGSKGVLGGVAKAWPRLSEQARAASAAPECPVFGPPDATIASECPKIGRFLHISLYFEFSIPYHQFDLTVSGFRTRGLESGILAQKGSAQGLSSSIREDWNEIYG